MTAIKENSTIQENKQLAFARCPLTFVMEKIGGYWKVNILFKLLDGPKRYSEIKRVLPGISEKVLMQQLRQLEADTLIHREAKQLKSPVVTYSLTETGAALRPVLFAMAEWALGAGGYNEIYIENPRDMENFPL